MSQLGQGWASPAGAYRPHPPSPSRAGPGLIQPPHIQVRAGTLLRLLAVDTGLVSEIVPYVYTDLRGCLVWPGAIYIGCRGYPVWGRLC